MFKYDIIETYGACKTRQDIIDNGETIVEQNDGTVSIFDKEGKALSFHLRRPCCEQLGYTYDEVNQKCIWKQPSTSDDFKIILNPEGNGSTIFSVDDNETCCLEMSFDYLFKFDCTDLVESIEGTTTTINENQKEIDELTSNTQEIDKEISAWQERIDEANEVPYVIECETTSTYGGWFEEANYDRSKYLRELYNGNKSTFTSAYNRNVPPQAYSIAQPFFSRITKYCLTDAGVTLWQSILEADDFQAWIASEGSRTSVYSCSEVNKFEANAQPGVHYTEACTYDIYDRVEAREKIAKYKAQIEKLTNTKTEIEATISKLEGETTVVETGAAPCESYIDFFENFNVSVTLEKLNASTGLLETVYEETIFNIGTGNFWSYIDNASGTTGIVISGDSGVLPSLDEGKPSDSDCRRFRDTVTSDIAALIPEAQGEAYSAQGKYKNALSNWWNSCWLQYSRKICDPTLISQLKDEKINISLRINDACADFSVMLDRLKLIKTCSKTENVETFISEPPKFEIKRVIDNKKSWIANKSADERDYELKYRPTEYETNHHKLVINTKEVDLSLSPARAVEQDVWCYIADNNCILEGCQPESGETFSAFTCPAGYTANTGGDSCSKLTITAATDNTSTAVYTVGLPRLDSTHNLSRGTIWVEDVSDKTWPIYWTITPENTWIGPYYQCDYLTDSSGQYLNHTAFGTMYKSDGSLRFSSPEAFSGVHSPFGSSWLPTVGGLSNPNRLWGGAFSQSGYGRLRAAGIYTDPIAAIRGEWLGTSFCVEIDEEKVYQIGFAGDDNVRVKVNGEWLFNSAISPTTNDELGLPKNTWWQKSTGSGQHYTNRNGTFYKSYSRQIQCYVVVGVTLPAGKNIFQVEGIQGGPITSAVGFVMEIYDAPQSELKQMRSGTELSQVTVFSTRNLVGQDFNIGEDSGYSCPTGYALDTCVPPPYQCVKIETVLRSQQQKSVIECCCGDTPLFVKDYNNETFELYNLTGSTYTFSCTDIKQEFDTNAVSLMKTVTECGNVYEIGDKVYSGSSVASFSGFWFAEENNGELGVYYVDYTSGGTETYENVSDSVSSECCSAIDSYFRDDANKYRQGDDIYPVISWDPNIEKCVYKKCGDDGCTNLDDFLTTELSEIDSVKEFGRVLSEELIDAKTRQTSTAYPTLKMLYDRYNYNALDFCEVDSSRFDYFDMDNFGQSIGNYWVELIEQVVPATTIWESSYTYRNTIFDQQKYSYKRSSLFREDASNDYPFTADSKDTSVEVIISEVPKEGEEAKTIDSKTTQGVWVMDWSCGPNFLGRVINDPDRAQEHNNWINSKT